MEAVDYGKQLMADSGLVHNPRIKDWTSRPRKHPLETDDMSQADVLEPQVEKVDDSNQNLRRGQELLVKQRSLGHSNVVEERQGSTLHGPENGDEVSECPLEKIEPHDSDGKVLPVDDSRLLATTRSTVIEHPSEDSQSEPEVISGLMDKNSSSQSSEYGAMRATPIGIPVLEEATSALQKLSEDRTPHHTLQLQSTYEDNEALEDPVEDITEDDSGEIACFKPEDVLEGVDGQTLEDCAAENAVIAQDIDRDFESEDSVSSSHSGAIDSSLASN